MKLFEEIEHVLNMENSEIVNNQFETVVPVANKYFLTSSNENQSANTLSGLPNNLTDICEVKNQIESIGYVIMDIVWFNDIKYLYVLYSLYDKNENLEKYLIQMINKILINKRKNQADLKHINSFHSFLRLKNFKFCKMFKEIIKKDIEYLNSNIFNFTDIILIQILDYIFKYPEEGIIEYVIYIDFVIFLNRYLKFIEVVLRTKKFISLFYERKFDKNIVIDSKSNILSMLNLFYKEITNENITIESLTFKQLHIIIQKELIEEINLDFLSLKDEKVGKLNVMIDYFIKHGDIWLFLNIKFGYRVLLRLFFEICFYKIFYHRKKILQSYFNVIIEILRKIMNNYISSIE
ncbi:hypothetical protein A0H76_2626 [Hepatospora eriocheir]|uniref:Uncharacterized protein n=1 Tax=Hepatospora eriocheir TaxID=1081669 RepID=A0A1X0QFE4_9MICR|nr:hypothetical protein A0H76_2626 [Hepatospora eriocheir]